MTSVLDRCMDVRLARLTPEHQGRMPEWADKWIEIGLRTCPADRAKFAKGAESYYRGAGQPWPNKIVWVPSPFVFRLAAPVATALIALRSRAAHDEAVNDLLDVVRRAVNEAAGHADVADGPSPQDAIDEVERMFYWNNSAKRMFPPFYRLDADPWKGLRDLRVVAKAVAEGVTNPVSGAVGAVLSDPLTAPWRDIARLASLPLARFSESIKSDIDLAIKRGASDHVLFYQAMTEAIPMSRPIVDLGGNHIGTCLHSFYRDVCGQDDFVGNQQARLAYEAMSEAAYAWYAHPDFVMACERPSFFHRELTDPAVTRGWRSHRLHCDDGPAVMFQDGWGVYALHGVQIPFTQRHIVERPETITVAEIEAEKNAEIRRMMIDRYGGLARYVADSGATVVCELGADEPIAGLRTGRLLRKEVPINEPIIYADLLNSTPEPDGTVKRYMLRIDPSAYDGEASRNLLAAVASTWRNADGSLYFADWRDYAPVFES